MYDTAETPTMREQLARIQSGRYWDHALKAPLGKPWITRQEFVDTRWPEFVGDVDAILREMLEPSKGMIDAGRIEFWVDPDDHGGDISQGTHRAWQAMIQHILNETKD